MAFYLPSLSTLLLSRPDRVGDVIISTSCLEPIRAQHPDGKLFFIAREAMRPLLEGHPLLDGFIALPRFEPGDKMARERRHDWVKTLADLHADAAVHLHPDETTQFAAQSAKVPRRIGYKQSFLSNWTLTDKLPDHRRQGRRHEAEYNFDLLARLGIKAPPVETLRPSIHLADSWLQSLRIRLAAAGFDYFDSSDQTYAVLNPTAHSVDHRWPAENWAWLALELLKPDRFNRVFIVGESITDPSARALRRLLPEGVAGLIDLSGETTLGELGWLLRHAGVLVSRDTGPTHLAAAVGCPVVVLFGRLEPIYGPSRWRPLGDAITVIPSTAGRKGWTENKRDYWRRCYASFGREAVLEATLKHLATRPKAGGASDKE